MSNNASRKKSKTQGSNKTNQSQGLSYDEIKIEVYRYYQELARNEDRLLNERLMIFLTSHSILFLGYITSFQVKSDNFSHITGIRIALPIIGIVLCILGFLLVWPAKRACEGWKEELTQIEGSFFEEPNNLTLPYKAREEIEKGCLCSGKWPWRIGCFALPIAFLLLWVYSLIVSLCQFFSI
ncbi:MAG: hypothetical protein J7J06_08815 [Methanosarcinales archaeon]|nr:hypothetical protein [Methanosarcinales archaeon]